MVAQVADLACVYSIKSASGTGREVGTFQIRVMSMSADKNRASERITSSKMGAVRQDDNHILVMFGKVHEIGFEIWDIEIGK